MRAKHLHVPPSSCTPVKLTSPSGSSWDTSICSDPTTCAQTCCYDGSDYSGTYGITTSGNALNLKFVTNTNYGSRTYLMASDTQYQTFTLLGNEFTFDVDASNLPCGLNGALYFVSMDADGGVSKYSTNTAGAKFGTGYCDAQCPKDLKFINGLVCPPRVRPENPTAFGSF